VGSAPAHEESSVAGHGVGRRAEIDEGRREELSRTAEREPIVARQRRREERGLVPAGEPLEVELPAVRPPLGLLAPFSRDPHGCTGAVPGGVFHHASSGKIPSPLTRPRTFSGVSPIQTHPARRRMVRLRELPASLPQPASGGTWRAPVASTGHEIPGRRRFGVFSTRCMSESRGGGEYPV
jgi:hypothetical protein